MKRTFFLGGRRSACRMTQGHVALFGTSFIQFTRTGLLRRIVTLERFDFQSQTASQGKSLGEFCYEMWRAHHDQ
jgi:hypothetical protein